MKVVYHLLYVEIFDYRRIAAQRFGNARRRKQLRFEAEFGTAVNALARGGMVVYAADFANSNRRVAATFAGTIRNTRVVDRAKPTNVRREVADKAINLASFGAWARSASVLLYVFARLGAAISRRAK